VPRLTAVTVQNLRNIQHADLQFTEGMNIFFGENGAGKTSVLESIYLLSTARSFRTNKPNLLIAREADELTVFARYLDGAQGERSIGVQKSRREKSRARLDGADAKSSSELARTFPVLCIDPGSFDFIEGGPAKRRTMLDWLVFHVKPSFFEAYKDYVRCLKQRNILLRSDKISPLDLDAWDRLLCRAAVTLDQARAEATAQIVTFMETQFPGVVSELDLDFRYQSGWGEDRLVEGDEEAIYKKKLADNFSRDRALGHTSQGSHRFDLLVSASGKPSGDVLSRGQKKKLVVCFYLALASIFRAQCGKTPILLLDDLMSEIDVGALAWVLSEIKKIDAQTFVTTLYKENIGRGIAELEDLAVYWLAVTNHDGIKQQ